MRPIDLPAGIVPLALCGALTACSSDTTVAPRNDPGLHFVSPSVADTIDAMVAEPIELQLNDDAGAPRGSVVITVAGLKGGSPTHIATSLGGQYLNSVNVTTDASGRARIWAKLGMYVGREYLDQRCHE